MSFASPTKSSGSLDRFKRVGSSGRKNGKAACSPSSYSSSSTKPKRLQSAHYDPTTGTWRCKNCGWEYPNPEPHNRQRREHKKICPGLLKVQRWLSHGSGPSTTEDTDSHDTSSIVDKPTTPETADTATAKLSLGQKSYGDGANRNLDGGLAKTGDRVQAPQLLEREFEADETPATKELTREGEIQEVGDAKAAVHGEHILSDQSEIVGSNEKLGDLDDLGKKQSLYASDSTLPHDPSQDRSDQGDLSAFTNSTFEAGSQDTSSGNKEGRDIDMEEPLSLSSQNAADSLQGDQPIPFSPENRGKDQAEDRGEGIEQRKSRLAAAANQAEDIEDAEISSRADDNAQKEKPESLQDGDENQLTLTGDGNAQKQREEMGDGSYGTGTILTAADGVLREQEDHVGTAEGTPTHDPDGQDHGKHSYPNAVAEDGVDYEGGDEDRSGQSARDVGDEVLQTGRTPKPENAGSVLKSEQEAGNEIASQPEGLDWESLLDESIHQQPGEALGSSTDHHVSPGQDSLKSDRLTPFSDEKGVEDQAGELGEGFEQREPSLTAVVDQAEVTQESEDVEMSFRADQKQREEMGEGCGGITAADRVLREQQEDAGTEEGISLTDEDRKDHMKHTDPTTVAVDGVDYEGVGSTLSKTRPAAEVISGKPDTRRGVENFSWAHRNWDGWEDVVRGEDHFGENKMSPSPHEIDDAGQLLSVEGLTSHGQSDNFVNESGPTLEKAGGAFKSDQDAVNEIGTQPEGLDWASPLDKSVHTSLGDSPGSTFADHHLSPHKNWPEFVAGLDKDAGGNVPQQQTDQTNKVPLKLSAAEANWDDWDEVIKEVPMLTDGISSKKSQHPESSRERQTPGEETLGGGDMSEPGEGKTGQGLEGLSHEKQPDAMATSVHDEADALFHLPKPVSVPRVGDSLPRNRDFPGLDIGRTEGRKGMNADEETPQHESGQAGAEIGPLAQGDWSDLEETRKSEYVPGGGRPSSSSLESAHDGDLSSELEYPNAHKTAVKLPLGKRRWADWEDLTKSEYMVLDGPGGESLIFKRTSDARGSSLSKSLGDRESSSFEEPDDDGESPRLRSNRRQPPSFATLKGAIPGEVVTSDYSAGSLSFQGFETTRTSLPGTSPHKLEAGEKPSLVSHRPLLYRDSRRDYMSEVEDMYVTNEPTNPIVHYHDHNLHDHEDALKYDVQKILRGQTQYDLICPVCGAVITKKIVIRKKKRRFISQGDPRWNRPSEITPVENDESKSPRSDTSSEAEDASARWKQGIRPCFGYFFGS